MLRISSDLLALATASLNVRQRLDLPPGRCRACRDWPEYSVIVPGQAPEPTPTCACGFSPLLIRVEYVKHPRPANGT